MSLHNQQPVTLQEPLFARDHVYPVSHLPLLTLSLFSHPSMVQSMQKSLHDTADTFSVCQCHLDSEWLLGSNQMYFWASAASIVIICQLLTVSESPPHVHVSAARLNTMTTPLLCLYMHICMICFTEDVHLQPPQVKTLTRTQSSISQQVITVLQFCSNLLTYLAMIFQFLLQGGFSQHPPTILVIPLATLQALKVTNTNAAKSLPSTCRYAILPLLLGRQLHEQTNAMLYARTSQRTVYSPLSRPPCNKASTTALHAIPNMKACL